MKGLIVSLLFTLLLAGICDAEVLHRWVEPQPNHSFQNGDIEEEPFYTYTNKNALRSESGGSWSLTASATASANARAASPRPGDVSREWNANAQLRATGDLDTLTTEPPDALPKMEQEVENTKTSSDGTTTARRKRVAHVVSYKNKTFGSPEQRHLEAYTFEISPKINETPQDGHFHADDTWHAEPPVEPSIESPVMDTDVVNPTSTSSNPLFKDGVPEHLQCPKDLVGVYFKEVSSETIQQVQRIGIEILERWNPNRPLTEVWPAFIEVEKWYHDNAAPERAGIRRDYR